MLVLAIFCFVFLVEQLVELEYREMGIKRFCFNYCEVEIYWR
jgi:hypothetical protein